MSINRACRTGSIGRCSWYLGGAVARCMPEQKTRSKDLGWTSGIAGFPVLPSIATIVESVISGRASSKPVAEIVS